MASTTRREPSPDPRAPILRGPAESARSSRLAGTLSASVASALHVCRDKSVSKTTVVVEYGPQLVSGSAIFLAFKLGVSDIYSKTLPSIALQKTSSQKATVEGASVR